jgi:transposase
VEKQATVLNKANGRIAYRIFISSWDRQRAEPPSGESFRVSHDDAGLGTLIARMRPLTPTVVVLEATGGYEVTVAVALAGARLPMAVVNPRQIRDFTRATGQLAKTDALDGVIALFAEAIRPIARPVPDEHARALGELVARRRQLVDMLTAEQNRRRLLRDRGLQRSGPAIEARRARRSSELPQVPGYRQNGD